MDKKQNNSEWSNLNNNLITDFTPPKRLSGCLLTPREPTVSRSQVYEEDLEDTKINFENPRQKLKHYLLCGKKLYIRKSNGSVTADIPQDEFVVIPPGKLSIIPNSDDDKKKEKEGVIFSDYDIKKTINKTIQNLGSDKQNKIKTDNYNGYDLEKTNEVLNILKRALDSLKEGHSLQNVRGILYQIEDFELRFPKIASLLVDFADRCDAILLKKEILKTILLLGPKIKISNSDIDKFKLRIGGLI